jgi:formylglycine-generating enzyme required for sulfatase activity
MGSQPSDPSDIEALQRQIAELQARLSAAQEARVSGSGAAAQGGGDALGERGVKVQDNAGTIVTGKQTNVATQGGAVVEDAVQVRNGHFIGRDFIQCVTQITQGGEDPEESKSVMALYLHALTTDLAGVKLGEIDASVDQTRWEPLQLADIYVPLDTTLRIPQDGTLVEWLARDRNRKPDDPHEQREMRSVSAIEALAAHRKLTLLGKPGSGKSTFGASVLLALAQAWQGHRDELDHLGETWTHGALLPIRVVLRRFAEQLPPGDEPARAGDLWDFIGRDLNASGYGLSARTVEYVQRIARSAGAFILLDGLDECGHRARRERVLGAVDELIRSAGQNCHFLLTARPYAWPRGAEPDRDVYMLADLSDDQIEQFIRAWYAALVKRKWRLPGEVGRKVDDLLAARHRPDLVPLAQNPLLLTLMATLHTNRGRLPDDRADLYNDSVDLLLLRWNRQIGADKALLDELAIPGLKLSGLREVLEELAFKVHEANVGQEGTADIGEDRMVRAFRPLLHGSRDKAAVVVDYIEKRAGLLVGQGEKDGERQFTFPHRTFQEFLAACHLASQVQLNDLCVHLARQHAGHWKEILVLAARQARSDRGAALADAMIGSEALDPRTADSATSDDFRCAAVAAEQLREIGLANLASSKPREAVRKRVVTWLAGGLQAFVQVPEPPGRAYIGDLLGYLGDPRFDPQRFHLPADDMLGLVHIPTDPGFQIGTRKADRKRIEKIIGREAYDDEINDTATPTPEFYIARYPVTVAQFRAFVEATGVQPGDADALRDPDSRPVRYVSWHDAQAYCDWLNDMLAGARVLEASETARLVREQGWRIALPSELEWEKAARSGLHQTFFAWGDTPDGNRANYDESAIGDSSVVGCFPANGFGLYDMIGNLWECTRSLWGTDPQKPDFEYPYDPDDPKREALDAGDEVYRVVRGGSWYCPRVYARCAFRYGLLPDLRYYLLGFRVVLRSSPVR